MLKNRIAWIIIALFIVAFTSTVVMVKVYRENIPKQELSGSEREMLNVVIYGLSMNETYIISIHDNGDFNLITGVRESINNNSVDMKQIDNDKKFKMSDEDFALIKDYVSDIDEQNLSISDVVAKGPPQIIIQTKKTTYNGYLFATEYENLNSLVHKLLELSPIKLNDVIVSRY